MISSRNFKQMELQELLRNRILNGDYPPNSSLPSGLDLARELGTSYVTITRVFKALESEGYVTGKRGQGTFVNPLPSVSSPGKRIVNLTTSQGDHPLVSSFLELGHEIFSKAGWQVRVVRSLDKLADVKDDINDAEAFTVIFGIRPHFENYRASMEHIRRRVVYLGERTDADGVACVTADEPQSIRLCMNHFHDSGLKRIAMLRANLSNELESQRAAVWRSIMFDSGLDARQIDQLLWDIKLPNECPVKPHLEKLFAELLQSGQLSKAEAVIAPDVETAALFIGLMLDHGFKVPDDLQVAAIGSNALAELFRPQITSIDSNLKGHLQTALSIFENRLAGQSDKILFHLCQPRLIVRSSTQTKKVKSPLKMLA